ncbi:ROK family transcriptional regulator [Agromyces aerolatus]|uniref:ROK family transcriptional regulator n=1 Tax=Agromyces sp. LY-1074 TaxID=3074080 RepID=UPI0028569F62|nr:MULTISPECIES: ROK family transcriptional regulator [unclassified Agromyces]MDR5701496.1 ROK family transcriptional regulator [Agromyces sp. LY-1074]MDR5704437.1 ROK family transcriptional regulator [Agromyces sp. LY-1358]
MAPPSPVPANSAILLSPGTLLQLLRDGEPHTRAELAATTGMSRSTISARVDALRDLDLVRPYGDGRSTGGRPPAQFIFNPSSRMVLGIDLGAAHVAVGLADLAGEIIASHREPFDLSAGPAEFVAWVQREGDALLRSTGTSRDALLGVGLGVPGPVDASGRLISPFLMPGWEKYPLAEELTAHFGAPVTMDNDVNVRAMAEHRIGWPQVDNLLFVKAATGIGSGIVAGGQVQRGALGAAGDLGHFIADPESDVVCRCGNRGCLEAIASASALAGRFVGDDPGAVDRLIDLARSGDSRIGAGVREAARHIGAVLGSAVSLLNPSVVILGGRLASAGEPFLAGVRETIYQQAVPLATRDLVVVESRLREMGGVRGASLLSIDAALSSEAIDERVD